MVRGSWYLLHFSLGYGAPARSVSGDDWGDSSDFQEPLKSTWGAPEISPCLDPEQLRDVTLDDTPMWDILWALVDATSRQTTPVGSHSRPAAPPACTWRTQ